MAGGPSHLETLDPKPALAKMHGKPMPGSFTRGMPIAQLQGQKLTCFAPQHPFVRCGQSGQELSAIFPRLAGVADELCIIRSMVTEAINHDPAHTFMNTGTTISGRPAMGSWINYGLGSENDSLPGFVVLTSTGRFGQAQPIATRQWHSGFLPSRFQGVRFYSQGDPVLYLGRPRGVTRGRQRDVVDAVEQLNAMEDRLVDDPEIATRVSAYETAFRMQTSVPELIDLKDEPRHVLDLYGTEGGDGSFAANCLLARRLAERGVRFIQLYHRDWDHHGAIKEHVAGTAREVDQGAAALIKDLKQRGMLDDTLVDLGRRVRPHADGPGRRPRPPHQGLLDLDGRRGHQGGHHPRRHRRARLRRRPRRGPRPRPARHDPGPLRHRPPPPDLPLPGPRLPPHRRRGQGGQADPGVRDFARSQTEQSRRGTEARPRPGPRAGIRFPREAIMKLKVLVRPETSGGYSVSVPALSGCFSQGETLEEALSNIREAAELWLDVAADAVASKAGEKGFDAELQEIEL